MHEQWGWDPSSIEAIGAAAAGVFTFVAACIAVYAAKTSYALLKEQNQFSQKQTNFSAKQTEIAELLAGLETARAEREVEAAERDRQKHQIEIADRRRRSLPFLRLDNKLPGSSGGTNGYDVTFDVHNDGGAPALNVVLEMIDPSGVLFGTAGPVRIEPTQKAAMTVRVPPQALIASIGSVAPGVTVRVRDQDTNEQDAFTA